MAAPTSQPKTLAPHEGRLLTAAEVSLEESGLQLAGMQCHCGFREFPASDTCPSCLAPNPGKLTLSAEGTLYSYSVVHIAPAGWQVPYVIGYVDLPENVRVFGKVHGDPATLKPDMRVRVEVAEAESPKAGQSAYRYHFNPL